MAAKNTKVDDRPIASDDSSPDVMQWRTNGETSKPLKQSSTTINRTNFSIEALVGVGGSNVEKCPEKRDDEEQPCKLPFLVRF